MTDQTLIRNERYHTAGESSPNGADLRRPGERDRDRILYSSALRRLAGITQTVSGDIDHPVHNRLTHVLEVAQIGRRLTEKLLRDPTQREAAETLRIDPEVVEAACLAHDLGHPPYGHIAEDALNAKVEARNGFEGNAQTFRVVTQLADHKLEFPGLNLTRATLNAIIKYPWPRGNEGEQERKWNYYSTEEKEFMFARSPGETHTRRKSAEAGLMDWADDIAYSVHDMVDFYQAGKIPLDRFGARRDDNEIENFLTGVKKAWTDHKLHLGEDFDKYAKAFANLTEQIPIDQPYSGRADQRYILKKFSSYFIQRYCRAISLQVPSNNSDPFVVIDDHAKHEVVMLKELTWHYVIRDPALASQQYGQRIIIEHLFDVFRDACGDRKQWRLFPPHLREIAERDRVDDKDNANARCRLVCDIIASMSEQQTESMYRRLKGIGRESAFVSIIR